MVSRENDRLDVQTTPENKLYTPFTERSTPQGPLYSLVGQGIGPLIARITRMALDPAPLDLVSRSRHHMVQRLPKLHVFDGLLGRRAPTFGFPAMDPFGDALAHVFAVQEQGDFARPFERLEPFDHGGQLHAVVGGAQFAAKKLMHMLARLQAHAPATGARIAFTGTIGMDNDVIQKVSFGAVWRPMWEFDRAKGTVAAAGDRTARQRRPSSRRPPGTRLVAKIK